MQTNRRCHAGSLVICRIFCANLPADVGDAVLEALAAVAFEAFNINSLAAAAVAAADAAVSNRQ